MGKIFKYRLHNRHKSKSKVKKRGGEKKSPSDKPKKYLRAFFLLILSILLCVWLVDVFSNIRNITIYDVLTDSEDVYSFVKRTPVNKTLVVYESPEKDKEDSNLFIFVIILNTDTSELLIYYFPNDLYIKDNVANKYISIENLTYAGQTYLYGHKHAYVLEQISNQMAVDFDSYVWVGASASKGFFKLGEDLGGKDFLALFSNLTSARLFLFYKSLDLIKESLYSNMGFFDLYAYFGQISSFVKTNKHIFVDLGSKDMSNEVTLGSGRDVKILDLNLLDQSLNRHYSVLVSSGLAREQVKVEVYNATDIPMYARKIARRIHHQGCNVIRFNNIAETYEKNYIYIPNIGSYPVSLDSIMSIIKDPVVVESRPDFLTTGDIVVVLGAEKNAVSSDLE